MPLVQLRIGAPAGKRLAAFWSTSRRPMVGTTLSTSSASASASSRSPVAWRFSGRVNPGRYTSLTRAALIASASCW